MSNTNMPATKNSEQVKMNDISVETMHFVNKSNRKDQNANTL